MKPFLQAYNDQQIIVPCNFLHLKRNYSILKRVAPKPASQHRCSRDAQPRVSPIIEKLIVSNSSPPSLVGYCFRLESSHRRVWWLICTEGSYICRHKGRCNLRANGCTDLEELQHAVFWSHPKLYFSITVSTLSSTMPTIFAISIDIYKNRCLFIYSAWLRISSRLFSEENKLVSRKTPKYLQIWIRIQIPKL